ncbi:hypothetical protein [Rhizobium sp. BK176]|uniref:hypothetical protein n=1 Tax=Rhizobium sp. BK176 TaxID=2587071 RepID=UPI00216758EB|nr:hypothetical protein [Rhizobium sp. BK176]MCS4089541.1 hypothetical protein [Rhizobium sp. BK176]
MLGLWKSKKRKAEEEKNEFKAIVTEDLLGASDWKESKIGYLTGLSSIGGIAGNVITGVAQSFGRLGLMFKLLTKDDKLDALPEVETQNYDGKLRFRAAMQLHGVKESGIGRALINTRRSAYFYAALTVAAASWLALDLLLKDRMAITTLVLHIAPIPVGAAFTFKAAFTNWMFRHQRLESPNVFLASFDWIPKVTQ